MHQQISKRIFIYLFLFFLLGTFNNKNISHLNFLKINKLQLIDFKDKEIYEDLTYFQDRNLFFLEKNEVSKVINSHKIVESFIVFKIYPSSLNIKVKKAEFLAYTKKNGQDFYIGSNGKFIKIKKNKIELPFIFGNIEIKEFLKLKGIIDNSDFSFHDIKNFYYFKSKRWDIETKNNLLIKLPIEELELSFKILSKIYDKEKFNDVKIIDLRQNNQIILNG